MEELARKHSVRVLLYNKGSQASLSVPSWWRVQLLPNVGVCDHTYAHHIAETYDSLADITIFLPASAHKFVKKKMFDRVFEAAHEGRPRMVRWPNHSLYGDFAIDNYVPFNKENRTAEVLSSAFCLSPVRPLKNWWKQTLGPYDIDPRGITMGGVFSATADQLRRRPKKLYETLVAQLSSCVQNEVSHYVERAWFSIVDPSADEYVSTPRTIFLDHVLVPSVASAACLLLLVSPPLALLATALALYLSWYTSLRDRFL